MPLIRAHTGEPQADIDAVYFPMADADTGMPVVCKVSYEYLQKRTSAAEDSTGNEMLWAFQVTREKVEAMASEKLHLSEALIPRRFPWT